MTEEKGGTFGKREKRKKEGEMGQVLKGITVETVGGELNAKLKSQGQKGKVIPARQILDP